jgi:hypothetical protein
MKPHDKLCFSVARQCALVIAAVCAAAAGGHSLAAQDLPRWLTDPARAGTINQWYRIPNTKIAINLPKDPYIARGLLGAGGREVGLGSPAKITHFSGAALRKSGSWLLVTGGGGAGAWAGNDWIGLKLNSEAPKWETLIMPSPASQVWPRGPAVPAHNYMRDGRPNARHSYWSPHFFDGRDWFVLMGTTNVWEIDHGTWGNVDIAYWGTREYEMDPAKRPPSLPAKRDYDGEWIVKHPVTEDVYWPAGGNIYRFDQKSLTWSAWHKNVRSFSRMGAGIDPVNNLMLVMGNYKGDTGAALTFDIRTGALFENSRLVGPHAQSIVPPARKGGVVAAGFIFDEGLGKFVWFQDDGQLYTIAYRGVVNGAHEWHVDRLPTTGTPPVPEGTIVNSGGYPAVWGRMRYVPELKGIVLLTRTDTDVFFIRTSGKP